MQNSEYWRQRFSQLEEAQHRKAAETFAAIEELYRQAQRTLEGEIDGWYRRFTKNNGVTMASARRMLAGKELEELKWDVHDYIRHGKENAMDQRWIKELENASARFHISRMEALKLQTQQSLELLFGNQLDSVDSTMKHIYLDSYYHTAYELQRGLRIGWDIAGIDQKQVEKVIAKPWAADGKNFSERIWGNKEKLVSEVHKELTQNILLGQDPQKAIDAIAKKMNASKSNAGRLVMTEEAYFSSAAQGEAFHELDVEQYEIVATLDSHTSDICRNMDGKVFPMKDYEAGVTAPPFHVRCRTTTVPHFEDDFGKPGERAARDKETGKTYYVPANTTYHEWKKAFADGGEKAGFEKRERSEGKEEQWARLKDSEGIYQSYNFGQKDIIKPHNIKKNMLKSDIGKEMFEYLETNNVVVQLTYGADNPHNELGVYDSLDDVIRIFADKTKTVEKTAEVIIHEAAHKKYGIGGDKWSEAVCIAQEVKHRKRSDVLTSQEKRDILKLVTELYPDYPWRK